MIFLNSKIFIRNNYNLLRFERIHSGREGRERERQRERERERERETTEA